MENSIPCGISQRTQWMEKFSVYQQKFIEAEVAYNESDSLLRSPAMDGMPHGTGKSDPVANIAERRDKAHRKYFYARDTMATAKKKRELAMRPLDEEQKKVLEMRFFDMMSRRETAKKLGKSQTWVRCRERTGLFLLELPTGWENDILP